MTDQLVPFKDQQSRIWGSNPTAPTAVQPTKYGQELSLSLCVSVSLGKLIFSLADG